MCACLTWRRGGTVGLQERIMAIPRSTVCSTSNVLAHGGLSFFEFVRLNLSSQGRLANLWMDWITTFWLLTVKNDIKKTWYTGVWIKKLEVLAKEVERIPLWESNQCCNLDQMHHAEWPNINFKTMHSHIFSWSGVWVPVQSSIIVHVSSKVYLNNFLNKWTSCCGGQTPGLYK